MMRRLLWIVVCLFAVLGGAATLELAGFQSVLGARSHAVPAGFVASILDAMGMEIPTRGLILGHAHGPPFLQPMGIVLVYGVPIVTLAALLLRPRHPKNQIASR
jgi:hypothetical protein